MNEAVVEATNVRPSLTHEELINDVITVESGQKVRIHPITERAYRVNVWNTDRSGVFSTSSIVRSYFILIKDGKAVIRC